MEKAQKVLVIGGGFAGLECVRKLANDTRFEITLIDRSNHHLFQPLLYQVATASLPASDISRSLRAIAAHQKNVEVYQDRIETLQIKDRVAVGASGKRYEYDRLVVAAGARTGYFGNEHWKEHTHGLKSLQDAYGLRRAVLRNLELAELTDDENLQQELMTIAIVGGGPTGVELAGAFVDLIKRSMHRNFNQLDTSKLKVILIEAAPHLLTPYQDFHRKYVRERLKKMGVEVRTDTMVTDIQPDRLILKDGEIIAKTIVWAAGVQAADLTQQLPVETDRGGRVTPRMSLDLPGHPEIFVAGDLVKMKDVADVPVPGVAPAATQMGAHIAKILRHEANSRKTAAELASERDGFHYWDKGNMAIVGRSTAVVDAGNLQLQGFMAWLTWLFVHMLFLIDFRSKLFVLLQWGWAYVHDKPGARVYSGDLQPQQSAQQGSKEEKV